jgi:hypothetical protein
VRQAILFTLFLLPTLGLGSASAGPSARFRRVAETAHVRYYAAGDGTVDVRRTEEFLDRLFSLFGGAPRAWHLDYYRHASVAGLSNKIGFAAFGVTDIQAQRIDSVREYHPHELVHAVAGRLGQPPVMFTEGLAVALAAGGRWRGRDIDVVGREYLAARGSLDRLLRTFAEEDPERDYAVAGSFVAYLLDRGGIEPAVTFLAGCSDPGRYEQALRRAYGAGLAELEFAWQRALHSGSDTAARTWYDSKGWPGSLRRHPASSAVEAAAREHGGTAAAALEPAPTSPDRAAWAR